MEHLDEERVREIFKEEMEKAIVGRTAQQAKNCSGSEKYRYSFELPPTKNDHNHGRKP